MTSPTSVCPHGKCDGSGIIVSRNEAGREYGEFCECRGAKIAHTKLQFADIPREFADHSIYSFDVELYQSETAKQRALLAKKAASNFVKHFGEIREQGRGLYFYSYKKGSGKTRLAVSIGNALIKFYRAGVKFVNTINLLNEIKRSYQQGSEISSSELLQMIKSIDVLILDDIGTEKPTNWVNEIFYSILNDRMTAKKITIFTSNCSIEELKHDERVSNRIEKMAMPILFPDESIRKSIAQKENVEFQKLLLE